MGTHRHESRSHRRGQGRDAEDLPIEGGRCLPHLIDEASKAQ